MTALLDDEIVPNAPLADCLGTHARAAGGSLSLISGRSFAARRHEGRFAKRTVQFASRCADFPAMARSL
jgi:hypothetical protein